jgi:hypothetical protein
MFEQLFTSHGVLSRHRDAPLVEARERSRAARVADGLAPAPLQNLAQALRSIAPQLVCPADGRRDAAAIRRAAARWVPSQPSGPPARDPQGPRRRFMRVATAW